MSHIFKKQFSYWVDANGKRVRGTNSDNRVELTQVVKESRKWYAKNLPGYPPEQAIPLATDKNVALRMLAKLIDKGSGVRPRCPPTTGRTSAGP